MGLILLFRGGVAAPYLKSGYGAVGTVGAGRDATIYVQRNYGSVGTRGFGRQQDSSVITTSATHPTVALQVAFTSQPLSSSPVWEDLSARMREIGSNRGRSYEFDRMETGTLGTRLSNNDAELTPENTTSGYAPIKSTRPLRALLQWEVSYPMFRGITEGFPQTYQSLGKDALVQLGANDPFYALNNTRFTPGSTTLTADVDTVQTTIPVVSTALPMPQTVPFTITLAGTTTLVAEDVTVTEILSATEYTVTRAELATTPPPAHGHVVAPYAHLSGAAVTTDAVSFDEAYSGERIQQVLEAIGFTSEWYDLDEGQSLIAASADVSGVSPLEHINLIADAEFGRFFVSADGVFTFRDRHSIILDQLTEVFTFRDGADTSADEVPFVLTGELSHSEEKLYNRVKITIQGGDFANQIVDMSDEDSIDEHFERVFERTFPYANLNDADSAARFVLAKNAEAQLRLPGISIRPAADPSALWPLILAREIGDRLRFRYQPDGGGDEIDMAIAVEGIAHAIRPGDHVVTFQCSEVDSTTYWILGVSGYTELDETTKVGF